MTSYQKLNVSDVCEFIGGSQPPKTIFSSIKKEGYVRLVQTRDFKTDNFITYIPKNSTTKFFDKTDIIIGRYGPPIFQIFRGMEGAYNVALIKAKPKSIIDKDYLYYFLIQNSVFEYVDRLSARTGGQTGVDLFSLYKYPINLPDKIIQKKIAKVLSDLDAKIELNNTINGELEAMAKTIYDYWFVQFDFPFDFAHGRPDANGKPYKSSGGKMVWSEELKREIPEGWESKYLDYFDIYQPQTISEKELLTDGKYFVFGANGIIGKYDKFNHEESEIVVTCRGNSCGNIIRTIPKSWITGNAMVIKCREKKISSEFIYQMLNWIGLKKIITGSGQPQITRTNIETLKFILPDSKLLNNYDKQVKPLIDLKQKNIRENQHLSSLRDWLLPMLMNGQVKVNN